MTRRNPPAKWVLPITINPPARKCFTILVPDEELHVAAFRGALLSLASGYNWADDPLHKARLVARVWKDVVDNVFECGAAIPFACPYDLIISDGGFVHVSEPNLQPDGFRGIYNAGFGWVVTQETDFSQPYTIVSMRPAKKYPAAVNVNSIRMTYSLFKGSFNFGPFHSGIISYLAGNLVATTLVPSDTDPDGNGKVILQNLGGAMIDEIHFVVTASGVLGTLGGGGGATLEEVEVLGTGPVTC